MEEVETYSTVETCYVKKIVRGTVRESNLLHLSFIKMVEHEILPVFYVANVCKVNRCINPNNHNSIVCI